MLQWDGVEMMMRWLVGLTLVGNTPLLVLLAASLLNPSALAAPPTGGLFKPAASAVIFGFAGIEVSAFHLREAGRETYTAAVYASVVFVVILYAAGQLLV